MNRKQQEEVALFRFGIISDLVCARHEPGEMAEQIRAKARTAGWTMS